MTITEKVAYVRGLAQGLELDGDKKEVKLMNEIIDLLDDMALTISDLEDGYNEVFDNIESLDEDLCALEDDFYDDGHEGCDCDCDDEHFYEVTCPNCNKVICLSEDILLKGEIKCPNCSESIEFDFDDLCSDDCLCGSDECSSDDNCECDSDCECSCNDDK